MCPADLLCLANMVARFAAAIQMVLDTDVITRRLIFVLWLGSQHVIAAPTSTIVPSPATTPTPYGPNPSSYPDPYGIDPSNNSSSPMTTVIIVSIVGSIALLGAAWGVYSCMVTGRKSLQTATIQAGSAEPTTTMISIPGEAYPSAAVPALRYNSPYLQPDPNLEATEVGPGVVIPPPPSYDAATGGRRPDSVVEGAIAPGSGRPVQTRSDSRWKDPPVIQGRG